MDDAPTIPKAADRPRGRGPEDRQSCRETGCFATFESSAAHPDEIRHCNRGGPDGGHPHRWDGSAWQVVTAGAMQHDHR